MGVVGDTMGEYNGWDRSTLLRWRYNWELVGTMQEMAGSTVHPDSRASHRCMSDAQSQYHITIGKLSHLE